MRPNALFALSRPEPLLDGAAADALLETLGAELFAGYGLRSLARGGWGYRATCEGDQVSRDGAYHQGTVWTWLLGPFVEAQYHASGDAEHAASFMRSIEHHLRDGGLGTISEILDGDPPHLPRGCIAQAWSVAETLRVLRLINAALDS